MAKVTLPGPIVRSFTKPSVTMSLRRSGSTTTRRALRIASRSTVPLCIPLAYCGCFKEAPPLGSQQHPQAVDAERGAEWQDQQIDDAERKPERTTERLPALQEDTGPDADAAPD